MSSNSNVLPSFEVHFKKFDKPFPGFPKPEKIGRFSKNVAEDAISLTRPFKTYFYAKNLGSNLALDLRAGYESFISREGKEETNTFTMYLQWFKRYFNKKEKYHNEKPEFFCGRGLLRTFLTTPYEKREGWICVAEIFNGTIFLLEVETQQKIYSRMNETPRSQEMSYWGYKFEQYMTTTTIDGIPETNAPVDNTTPFYAVVKSQLGCHSIICGGEIDCCESCNGEEFVELKTSREVSDQKQKANFVRYKLLKFWAQSIMLGVPKIVCGFRDDEGIVRRTEAFITSAIPEMDGDVIVNKWKASVCFNCCNDLLDFIKETVNLENRVYKFTWYPNLGPSVNCEVVTDITVLPQDFKDRFKNYC